MADAALPTQDRVEGYAIFNGSPGVTRKVCQEGFFIVLVEAVDDLIGKPDKAIDRIDRIVNLFCQESYAQREARTVRHGRQFAALHCHLVKP